MSTVIRTVDGEIYNIPTSGNEHQDIVDSIEGGDFTELVAQNGTSITFNPNHVVVIVKVTD